MYLIGLTGGIASGKSVIAKRLGERGAVVVDADALAREVVEPGTPALAEIARAFGDSVISADGSLDRAALGQAIFSDPAKRELLNAITHPAVSQRSHELFDAAAQADPHAVVVYDIPLLVETGRASEFDLVVVAHASAETRVARMTQLRGMTPEDALRRIASQATDAERLAVADVVIDTDGGLEDTLRQADTLWERASAASAASRR